MAVGTAPAPRRLRSMVPLIDVLNGTSQRLAVTATLVILRQRIENKPVSLANLRLAHLISAGRLTNLVVTTNFDDLLTKALRLFGQQGIRCPNAGVVH